MMPVNQSRLEQVGGRYPWIPCSLRSYTFTHAKTCSALLQTTYGAPLKVAYVGDSRTRELMADTFKTMLDKDAWRMYFKPRGTGEEEGFTVMNTDSFLNLIDYHIHNKNLTWVDRLARATFNYSKHDVTYRLNIRQSYGAMQRKQEENSYFKSKPNTRSGLVELLNNTSIDTEQKVNGDRSDGHSTSGEGITASTTTTGSQQPATQSTVSVSPTVSTVIPIVSPTVSTEIPSVTPTVSPESSPLSPREGEASDEVYEGLIRLEYLIALYPHQAEMEASLPLLLTRLEKYRRMHPLDLPPVIVISTILWELHNSKREMLKGLEYSVQQLTLALPQLSEVLRVLRSRGVTIVWMMIDPVRNKMQKSTGGPVIDTVHPFTDDLAEWFNTVTLSVLRPLVLDGTILPWDAGLPVSERVNSDCGVLTQYAPDPDTGHTPSWRCWDFLHPHYQSNQVYAQMILNYLCNDVMEENGEGYCCT